MSKPSTVIELTRLNALQQQDGIVTIGSVKVNAPTPCKQQNAPGRLRRFATLEEFRNEARSIGKTFKLGLASE